MKSTVIPAAGLALLNTAQAGVVMPRQGGFDFTCNGKESPDRAHCEALYANFADGTQTFNCPQDGKSNQLYWDDGETKNCRIEITWNDKSYTVTGNQVSNGIRSVIDTCFYQATGGDANDLGDRYSVSVRANPNYIASLPVGSTNPVKPPKKREDPPLIPMGRTIEPERMTSVVMPKFKGKRQDDEGGDTGFSFGVHTTYAKPPEMKKYVETGLGGTSLWTWSKSKSVTNSVTVSVSVEATFFKVLKTTLGTEISNEKTSTSGTAQAMTVVCEGNQIGQVYFQAYAEVWSGVKTPSGEPLTVTKPMEIDGKTDGFYSWECTNK